MVTPTLAQHVLTAGMALSIAYAVGILVQRHNRAAHRWLALFLVCMALMAASESLAIGAREDAALLRWQGFTAWCVAALAPALFMYIRQLLSAPRWSGAVVALHFVPALLIGVPLAALALRHPDPEFWRAHARIASAHGVGASGWLGALLALQWAGYGAWAWALLQRYRRRLQDQYSNVDDRRMGWLGVLIACLPALLLLWLIARLGGADLAAVIDMAYVPVGVAVLATLALRQPAVLLEPLDPHPAAPRGAPSPADGALAGAAHAPVQPAAASPVRERAADPAPTPPPAEPAAGGDAAPPGSGPGALPADAPAHPTRVDASADASADEPPGDATLDEARWAALQQRLEALLAVERPYLDNDLSLATLARSLQTSTHHLSYLLNHRLGQSFYELVNERRVREVQRCLADPAYAGVGILEIAFDAGFSSKATFNAAFRRHTGMTPRDYRQRAAAAAPHPRGAAETPGAGGREPQRTRP